MNLEHTPLEQIARTSWQLLRNGIASNGAFRFPVLATATTDAVDARVLVLRRADEASQTLEFHTDVRSAKVGQLDGNKQAIWVFYDHTSKLQVRVRTTAEVGCDELANARWLELNDHTKRAYAQLLAPGTPVDELHNAAPCSHVENVETGRPNFAVVVCTVSEIEWLLLSRAGHRRALSKLSGTEWSTSWIMP
ncbi:MAG: pyridoxamine 5'-phosphate oxidase family protein [Gammaproteobacteria bacterium]